MTWQLTVFLAMKILGGAFCTLVFIALVQRIKNRIALRHGPAARALALAGNRYVKGEIDADSYRRIRDDLRN